MNQVMVEPRLQDTAAFVGHDERLRRLKFDIEEVMGAQQTLFMEGEVKAGEQKYHETLELQERAMTERANRLKVTPSVPDGTG